MGAAASESVCASTIFSQTSSVGFLALNIATLGASSSATKVEKTTKLSKLIKKFKDWKATVDKHTMQLQKDVKNIIELNNMINVLENTMNASKADDLSEEDIVRTTAQIAALVDPSGVASVVAAYTYPKCSEIRLDQKKGYRDEM